jgi:hypothetical protein
MTNFKNAFGWDIKQTPIYNAQGEVINGYKEITRDDDESLIAVMKKTFHPMTTQEFTDVVEKIASQVGAEVAGYEDWERGTNMGARKQVITAQIKMSEPLHISGSKIQGYLTIGVGFDGGRSFFVGHSNEFLRCTNQFGAIISEMTSRLTKNNMIRVDDIVNSIGIYSDYEKALYSSFERFQSIKIDEKVIKECMARIAGLSQEERLDSRLISTQKLNKIDEVMASVRTECAELGQTAWGLFNGVTHYTTHVMNSRNQDMFGNLFGSKNTANQVAYGMCESLLV